MVGFFIFENCIPDIGQEFSSDEAISHCIAFLALPLYVS
jgi:hypothetical protein